MKKRTKKKASRLGVAAAVIVIGAVLGGGGINEKLADLMGSGSDQPQQGVSAAALDSDYVDTNFTQALDSIRIAPKDYGEKYDRGEQFATWKTATEYGWPASDYAECTTRDAVLLRDGNPGTHKVVSGSDECDSVAGTWTDQYGVPVDSDKPSGNIEPYMTTTDPGELDIEHIVPLGEVWVSGANGWTQEKRYQIANDPRNLTISDPSANRSKGNQDAAHYLPPGKFHCPYISHYVTVKAAYTLSMTQPEHDRLATAGKECGFA